MNSYLHYDYYLNIYFSMIKVISAMFVFSKTAKLVCLRIEYALY